MNSGDFYATEHIRWVRKNGACGPVEGIALFVRGIIVARLVLQQCFIKFNSNDPDDYVTEWRDVPIDMEASEI